MATTSLGNAPPWLILAIVDQLSSDERVAALVCLSCTWREIIEARTFQVLDLTSTAVESFRNIVTPIARRQSALAVLRYGVVLPQASIENLQSAAAPAETGDSATCYAVDDQSFTLALHDLFTTLRS